MEIYAPIDFAFETRKYDENSTPQEIEAIQNRVFVYDSQIICFKELVVASAFSINLLFDRAQELSDKLGAHGYLIDLRNTQRPDASARRTGNQRMSQICDKVGHVAFCTGQNMVMNTMTKFLMYQTNFNSFSFHKTIQQSVKAIKTKINE